MHIASWQHVIKAAPRNMQYNMAITRHSCISLKPTVHWVLSATQIFILIVPLSSHFLNMHCTQLPLKYLNALIKYAALHVLRQNTHYSLNSRLA